MLSTDPGSAEGHHNLGIALMSQRELEEGMVHFRRALELEPRFEEAHYYLGMLLYKQAKPYREPVNEP